MKVSQLRLEEGDYFTIRIGIKSDAQNVGGFNIFGKGSGDFQQDIEMNVIYQNIEKGISGDEMPLGVHIFIH